MLCDITQEGYNEEKVKKLLEEIGLKNDWCIFRSKIYWKDW
jgi:hypothetical protein